MMSGTGGRSVTPEGKIARSFPAVRLNIHLKFTQKDGLQGRTGEMGFPPKGVPPLELTFFAEGRLGKGGSGRGLRGKPLGGKPSVTQAPLLRTNSRAGS